jgi:secreted trypsin-like serine protease
MICAGGKEGHGACHGDSGGPLQCKINDQYVQVGVVSWGKPCAHEGHPTVYTRISKYADWINKHITES